MAQQVINIGASPNDGTGDQLRTAFEKCNDNFTELYASSGAVDSVNGQTGVVVLDATDVDALQRDGSNANSDIDIDTFSFNAKSIHAKGTAGAGHLGLKHQSSNATASASETSLFAGSDGELYYKNDGNAVQQLASQSFVNTGLATKQDTLTNPITGTGANGQVAFFNGATTQLGDNGLFWDNTNKRLGIGTTSPQSRLDVRAQGSLSTDIAFRVRNSADTGDLFTINGNGGTGVAGVTAFSGRTITLAGGGSNANVSSILSSLGYSAVLGTSNVFRTNSTFAPTSGNSILNIFTAEPIINQTGGANGITRGLFVNPTLTSAADWRSIEWSNNTGRGLWGSGTANNAMAGSLNVGAATNANASAVLEATSTTQGFLPPRMTTTQRNAIASPAAGLIVYDTTLNKLCVRTASAWETITSI